MKRLLIILSLALMVAGCTKEETQLRGVWALKDYTLLNGGDVTNAKSDLRTLNFKKGGIGYVNGTEPIEYSLSGNQIILRYTISKRKSVLDIQYFEKDILQVAKGDGSLIHKYDFRRIE